MTKKSNVKKVRTDTGEVTVEATEYEVTTEEAYFKTYKEGDKIFVKNPQYAPVFTELSKRATFCNSPSGPLMVYMNEAVKKEIADSCDIKPNSVTKVMRSLLDLGVMKRRARGTYQMNPYCIGKGSWTDVQKARAHYYDER